LAAKKVQAKKPALTGKQELFALHYAACLNATEAARRAGYAGDDNALAASGSRSLRNVKVRARIDAILAETTMQPKEILARLTAQARGDMGDFIDPATLTVNWKRAKALGITHLIKKVKVTTITNDDKETQVFEFELHDPQSALVHLGKAYALFTDKLQVDDWRSKAIDLIRSGEVDYPTFVADFGESLADELFRLAGIPASTTA
jgi:phage terminase small subunit